MRSKKKAGPSFEELYREAAKDREELSVKLRREKAKTRAMGEAAGAALAMYQARHPDSADLILVSIRRMHFENMRDAVSHEPGGIAFAALNGGPDADG